MSFDPEQLHVIAVISNPMRFKSRYHLYREFEKQMKQQGVHLITVEAAFGDRKFEVTKIEDQDHIQLVTRDPIWHKENMINLGIQRLPLNWKYVAWIDADVTFVHPNWAVETIHALQHYDLIQLFETAIDLGPDGEPLTNFKGFMYSYLAGLPLEKMMYGTYIGHTGFAWAATRDFIEGVGGLIDRAALGSADHHMAFASIGKGQDSLPGNISQSYKDLVITWQDDAVRTLRDRVGYLPGTVLHHWHGRKKTRYYKERWEILTSNNFDPVKDLRTDWQGLLQFSDVGQRLRRDFDQYFRSRKEDSNDL